MEASEYVRMARRWWWLLVAAAFLGAAGALVASSLMTPTYRTSATLLVARQPAPGVPPQRSEIEASVVIANTLSDMVTLRPILDRAREQAGLSISIGDLRRSLSVDYVSGSQIIEITATSDTASMAAASTNAVADAFVASPEVLRIAGLGTVTVVSPAGIPSAPTSPQTRLNVILGALLTSAIAAAVIVVIEYTDDRVRSVSEVERLTGLPILGRLRRYTPRGKQARLPALRPGSEVGEDYRKTRTRVLAGMAQRGQGGQILLVTSAGRGDGSSTVAANLAAVMGLADRYVLLIDANLRDPALHELLGVRERTGLSGYLTADHFFPATGAIRPTAYERVDVLLAGNSPANPSELLGSDRMRSLLAEARTKYDLIIVDSPSVLAVTDALVLAMLADSVVLVARQRHTRGSDLQLAASQVASVQRELIGVIVNGARGREEPDPEQDAPSRRPVRRIIRVDPESAGHSSPPRSMGS